MTAPASSLTADLDDLAEHRPGSTDRAGWTDATDLRGPALGRRSAAGLAEPLAVAVGIDLVTVSEIADAVERLGERYLLRVFTPHELACCRAEGRPEGSIGVQGGYLVEALAARFAAKEAAVKVLRPIGVRPEWRTMEVHRTGGGWCELRLSGMADAMASEAGIDELLVSLTHEPTMAAAVVVGVRRDPQRPSALD